MSARGFRLSLLNQLIRAGLATSYIHREDRGAKIIENVRVKITEAGRKALQDVHPPAFRLAGRHSAAAGRMTSTLCTMAMWSAGNTG